MASTEFELHIPKRLAAPFGIYVHVPFCATRCGYCDFNTYTAGELGSSASPESWLEAARWEIRRAAAAITEATATTPSVDTVFFGGGTPSMVGHAALNSVLAEIRTSFSLAPEAEVTTEANPESVSPSFFDALREGGFTRISLGMQSTAPNVLATLDRTHSPGRALAAVGEARAAGFAHVSLDLIYGTPGETDSDFAQTIDDVLSTEVDHVSAYSLIVEDGTALARKVRRGDIAAPREDVLAHRYEMIAKRLESAGFQWYEVSNWARRQEGQCRHNLGYWRDGDWWGVGPGAHSHLGGYRWWNRKHPATYAASCAAGRLPIADGEVLSASDRHIERIMLRMRLAEGIAHADLHPTERERMATFVDRGLVTAASERYRITDAGRLLVDGIVRDILDD